MKKLITSTLLLLLSINLTTAQIASKDIYKVTYKIGRYDKGMKPKQTNRIIQKALSIMEDLEFELFFNEDKSLFKRKDIMVPEGEELYYKIASIGVGEGEVYFKNKKEKFKTKDFFGQYYKVIYPYHQYNWKLTQETKIISGYKCYKAIGTYEEKDLLRNITNKFTPVAWFTKELPYSFGPKGFDGLPGLVLEVSLNGQKYFRAIKVKKSSKVKFPKLKNIEKSESITYLDYLKRITERRRSK